MHKGTAAFLWIIYKKCILLQTGEKTVHFLFSFVPLISKQQMRRGERVEMSLNAKKRSNTLSGPKRDTLSVLVSILILLSLLVFNVLPLVQILTESLSGEEGGISFAGYVRAIQFRQNREAIVHTLVSSSLAALLSTVIGFIFSYSFCYIKMRMKKLFNVMALLPIISPPFSVALSVILLLGNKGLITKTLLGLSSNNIYGFGGLLFAQVFSFFPMAYLLLNGVLCTIDPSIEEAAQDMGASRFQVFTKVTLPLSLPGIINAFLLVFIKCIADFGNPMTIAGQYNTMATQIYYQAVGGYELQRCSALAILLLVIAMIVYLASQLVLKKRTFVTITGKATRERTMIEERSVRLPFVIICTVFSIIVAVIYLMIPVASFIKLWGVNNSFTLENYQWAIKATKQALGDTIRLAGLTTPLTGVLAMVMAFLIVRKKSIFTGPLGALGMLGMIVPGTILGYAYILTFNSAPFYLTGTFLILVISCSFRYLPVGLQSGITSLQQIDPSIEESASDLGANSFQVFTKVTLPMIKSSFFGGLVYTFVRTMTAMSALIFLISARHKLLTISIMDQVDRGKYGIASAMSTMMIMVVLIAIFLLYQLMKLIGVNKKDIKLM